jgi:hypothetical protein
MNFKKNDIVAVWSKWTKSYAHRAIVLEVRGSSLYVEFLDWDVSMELSVSKELCCYWDSREEETTKRNDYRNRGVVKPTSY